MVMQGLPGGTSWPKLVAGKGSARVMVGKGSSEILEYADKKITKEEDRLYPSDPEQRQLVKSWGMCMIAVKLISPQSQAPCRKIYIHFSLIHVCSLTCGGIIGRG